MKPWRPAPKGAGLPPVPHRAFRGSGFMASTRAALVPGAADPAPQADPSAGAPYDRAVARAEAENVVVETMWVRCELSSEETLAIMQDGRWGNLQRGPAPLWGQAEMRLFARLRAEPGFLGVIGGVAFFAPPEVSQEPR